MRPLAALTNYCSRQESAAPLAVVRAIVGLDIALCAADCWFIVRQFYQPDRLRVPFDWGGTLPLPEALAVPFVAVLAGLGLLLAVGIATRPVGLLASVMMFYFLLMDQQTYSNHLYLLAIEAGLIGLAWLGPVGPAGQLRVARWPVTLLKVQISVVYFFAAVSKLTPAFLSGSVLAEVWASDGLVRVPADWQTPVLLQGAAWATVVTELFLAFALWSRRWRGVAAVLGPAFHLGTLLLVPAPLALGVMIFAIATLAPYGLFFVDDSPAADSASAAATAAAAANPSPASPTHDAATSS